MDFKKWLQTPFLIIALALALAPTAQTRAEIDLSGHTYAGGSICESLFLKFSQADFHSIETYLRPLKRGAVSEQKKSVLQSSEDLQNLQSFEPAEDLPKISEDFGNGTISTWLKQPRQLRRLLRANGVPEYGWKYYDRETGRFNYQPNQPVSLALENGDARLQAIHLNHDHNDNGFRSLLSDYKAVLDVLPTLQFIVVTTPEDFIDLNNYALEIFGENWREHIQVVLTDEARIYVWTQDASKPLADGLATMLPAQNHTMSRPSYRATVEDMEKAGVVQTRQSIFTFDGGNIIVGSQHVIVGPDVVARAMHDFRISRTEALDALSKEFGRPIIEVGYFEREARWLTSDLYFLKQVDFHIDLTLSIVRNRNTQVETAVVQSPRLLYEHVLGVTDLDKMSPAQFAEAKLNWLESLRDQVLAGKLHLTKEERGFIAQINSHSLNSILTWDLRAGHVAKILADSGYTVVRIPGINVLQSRNQVDTYNYTNAIFSDDLALVPSYDVRWVDELAHSIYQGMGYQTIPMPSTQTYICQMGGIRCASETYRFPVYNSSP